MSHYDMLGRLIEKIMRVPKECLGTLMTLAEKLAGKEGSRTSEELKKFLRKEPCWVEGAKSAVINPAFFFADRPGLRVDETFCDRILTPALEMPETTPASIGKSYTLLIAMTDGQILSKIDNKIFEDPYAFCLMLAGFIDRQWGGKKGNLLTNGCATVFYVRGPNRVVFSVTTNWDADSGTWYVGTCQLLSEAWLPGRRVFPSKKAA